MTELSDQILLTYWYRNRNAEAFHVLASRHARMVYATALRVLRDVQAAEDVSQESFLALAQAKRPPSRNVAAWLHRTAYHAALDAIRSRKRRDARDLEYSRAQPAVARIAWDDIRELVDEAVASLPESSREPLVRYFFEQESHAAIATALGIPRQTVTHRIGKGVEQVRKQLKEKGVIAPASAALAALIQENSAQAMPAAVMQEVGRTALVATPSTWAVFGSYTSGAGFKVAAAMLMVGAGVAVFVGTQSEDSPTSTVPVAMAGAVAAPPTSVAPAAAVEREAPIEATRTEILDASGVPDSPMASVSGVVLLPDGKPFALAKVSLMDVAMIGPDGMPLVPRNAQPKTAADGAGQFSISDVAPTEYIVYVTEPGNDRTWSARMELARIALAPGEGLEGLELRYGTEGDLSITGMIVGTAGEPLRDVFVCADGSVPRSDLSDQEGQFSLNYLPDEQVILTAILDGYANSGKTVQAGAHNVQIMLTADGAIGGQVVDAETRKPVDAFSVSYIHGHVTKFERGRLFGEHSVEATHGGFSFDPAPAGDLTVAVRASGYATGLAPVTVEEGQMLDDLVIELQPDGGRRLAGSVVTADGRPVEGATIYTESIPSETKDAGAAVTDALGAFEIAEALPEVHVLHATHPDFAPAFGAASDDTTIVMHRGGRLTVEVYSGGAPRPKTNITVVTTGYGSQSTEARTDESGRAVFEKVAPGELQLHVRLANERTQIERSNLAPGEEKVVRVDVAPAEASVEGTVYVDGELATKGRARLFVETETGTEILHRSITEDGTFRFTEVPLGSAQLIVGTGTPSRQAFVEDVNLVAGQVTTLTVDATAAASISGTVSGLGVDEEIRMILFRGTLELDEALVIAAGEPVDTAIAARPKFDESGAFEAPLQKPGTYTVVLFTYPEGNYLSRVHRDYRVVEVPESGELNLDFNFSP
jgi:RNA polymerase sigma-70 factor (ECF subfamily)